MAGRLAPWEPDPGRCASWPRNRQATCSNPPWGRPRPYYRVEDVCRMTAERATKQKAEEQEKASRESWEKATR